HRSHLLVPPLQDDAENWVPIFGKDHAPITGKADGTSRKNHPALGLALVVEAGWPSGRLPPAARPNLHVQDVGAERLEVGHKSSRPTLTTRAGAERASLAGRCWPFISNIYQSS